MIEGRRGEEGDGANTVSLHKTATPENGKKKYNTKPGSLHSLRSINSADLAMVFNHTV
jgi:hypothetical protein